MRALAAAVATAILAAAPAVRAGDAPPVDAAASGADGVQQAQLPAPEASERARARRSDRWGLAIDAGVPQGASVGLMFRPVPTVRFWAGPAWNYVGWGVQAGIAAVPWHFVLTPVISAEVGRYFKSDVSFLANDSQGVPSGLKPLLDSMTYSYAAAHVGIELGSQRGLNLSLLAGLSYISLATKGTATTTATDPTYGTVTVTFTDPRVRGTFPSVKLGLQYWF